MLTAAGRVSAHTTASATSSARSISARGVKPFVASDCMDPKFRCRPDRARRATREHRYGAPRRAWLRATRAPVFRRGVRRISWKHFSVCNGSDRDDVSGFARRHRRQERPHQSKRRGDIQREQFVEHFVRGRLDWGNREHSSVVNEDVDRLERARGGISPARRREWIPEIGGNAVACFS